MREGDQIDRKHRYKDGGGETEEKVRFKKSQNEGVEEKRERSSGRGSRMQIVSNSLFSVAPGCLSCCRRPVEQHVDVWGVAE